MWRCKYERPHRHDKSPCSDPFRAYTLRSREADKKHEEDGANIGGADDEARLGTGQVELSL